MTVNPPKTNMSESPWNKPFKFHESLLQPFSMEVLPKQDFDCARLHRFLPAKTRIFIPHLPKTTLKEIIVTVRNLKLAGFEPVPHVAARRIADSSELMAFLASLYEEGVQELLVIAGNTISSGEYKQCIDLLDSEVFTQFRFKRLLFAGHPEGHPDVDRDQIEGALLKKIRLAHQRGYETAVVTQFCFNIQATRHWLHRIRNAGINEPIYIGLTGPASFKTLLRFASICGVSASADQFIKQPLQMWNMFFRANPDCFVDTLMKQSEFKTQIAGFHLFPFGGIDETIHWVEKFSITEKIF